VRTSAIRFVRLPKPAAALLAVCWLAMASGCAKRGIPAPQGGSDVPPSKVNLRRNVELCQVEQRALISAVESVGQLEAELVTPISPGVAGIVDEVLFREGDEVDPAQKKPLVKIEQRRYRAALTVAESNEKEAAANLNAARDAYRRASESGSAVAAELRKQALEAMSAAEAKLQAAGGALDLARHNHARSQVMPPFKGRINTRTVTPGSYVEEKTIIATLADLSRIRLVGAVPETAAPLVRDRMTRRPQLHVAHTLLTGLAGDALGSPMAAATARVLIDMGEVPSGYDPEFVAQPLPRRTFRAGIFYMCTVADPTTHMFECKAEIDPRTLGFASLDPGFSARIRFPLETAPDALVVPEEALRATERGFIVFEPAPRQTRDGQTEWIARPRHVERGASAPGWVEIRQGLLPTQWIVRKGAEALEDGTPLRISPEQLKLLEPRN
jgi:membrane fusion protein, multidrug efflux system